MSTSNYESKLYLDRSAADAAIERLSRIGYAAGDISLILDEASSNNGAMGVEAGGAAGGLVGALLAVAGSAVAIASTGGAAAPVVAGPLVSALAGLTVGAVSGVVVGGLLDLGEHADNWDEHVAKGGIVVAVTLKTPADRERVRNALNMP